MESDPRHRVVVAAMIEREGKLLAACRPQGGWGAGKWEFPGGKVDPAEDPRHALVRECREELGVEVSVGEVYEVLSHRYDDLGSLILLFFRASLIQGEPRALDGGRLAWVGAEEILEYDWLEADTPLVRQWAAENASREHPDGRNC